MPDDLTPDALAELQRLLDAATARPWMVDDEGDDVAVIVDEGDEFSFIQIAADLHQGDDGLTDARLIVAAVNALPDLLAAAAERDALRSMMAGRCLSGITHRNEEHRQSVCMLPEGHAPLVHDDCTGCTWTDANHWEPQAVDRLADELARIADESQREGWDSPAVRRVVDRLRAAFEEPLVPVLGADGMPVVRTVGDLTARHIGRQVRVETDRTLPHRERVLREIATASNKATRLTLEVPDHPEWFLMAALTLDTPCEVLP